MYFEMRAVRNDVQTNAARLRVNIITQWELKFV